MKFFRLLAGGCLAFSLSQTLQAAEDQSGVVLSFDDTFVKQWHDYFSQSAVSDVKATFFVSHWHTLSNDEVNRLKELRAAGHEIGNHTYSHKGVAGDFNFDPNRIDEYLNEQIIPSIQNMQADGFNPVSFSYPSGERNEVYDAAVRAYFPYMRTTFADENRELFQMGDIFHSANKNYGVLAGDGIDNSYDNALAEIEGAFLRAKTNNEIVTLYAHRIIPDSSPDADHRFAIRYSKLTQVIAKAREMGLKFYTFSEAYEIGNQQPVEPPEGPDNIQLVLEGNRVRLQWTDLSNDFVGIVPVGQSEWVEGMPGADTAGGQNGKIGINVKATATDQQYVAIFYNNLVEVGRSAAFVIAGDSSLGGSTGDGGGDTGDGAGETNGGGDTGDGADGTNDGGDTGDGGTSGGGNDGEANGDNNIIIASEGNRVRLAWSALANDFIGIVPADQSEWTEGMAGAETGGAQQGKIGITVQPTAVDQQYVAIFYSGGVKVGTSQAITVPGSGSGSDGGTDDNAGGSETGSNGGGTGGESGSGSGSNGGETGDNAGGSDNGGSGSDGSGSGDSGSDGNTGGGTTESGAATIEAYTEGNRARLAWANLATDFIGIVPAEQSEWLNGMPGAFTDGGNQGKMGITVSAPVPGQLYKTVFYRGEVAVGVSEAFAIN